MKATYSELQEELSYWRTRYRILERSHDELRQRYTKLLSEHITEIERSSRKSLEIALGKTS